MSASAREATAGAGPRERPADAAARSIALLQQVFATERPSGFSVRLWDGTTWGSEGAQRPRFTLVLRHPGALRRMLWAADELSVSEAFLYDDVDVEGDLGALVELADRFFARPVGPAAKWRFAQALLGLPGGGPPRAGRQKARLRGARHSKARDRSAIAYHYDVSDAFFALWLDRRMVYSCAYFADAGDDIDEAQQRKLDHVCRKLRLRPGERLLDVGCGWGALVVHAGLHYGVGAVGITLSRPQADYANEWIARAGLADRCRAECVDYRDVAGSYDKIASIGMVEHVGAKRLSEYFRCVFALLRPGGVLLNHGIAFAQPQPRRGGPSFFDRYVFPDGELLPLSAMLHEAEGSGFEVRDVESLREHYERTLRHWLARLEARRDDARRVADEVTFRVWRLYMSLAAHQFATGRTTVFQTLLAKPDRGASGLPLTRSDWYA